MRASKDVKWSYKLSQMHPLLGFNKPLSISLFVFVAGLQRNSMKMKSRERESLRRSKHGTDIPGVQPNLHDDVLYICCNQ